MDFSQNQLLFNSEIETFYRVVKPIRAINVIQMVSFKEGFQNVTLPEKYALSVIEEKFNAGIIVCPKEDRFKKNILDSDLSDKARDLKKRAWAKIGDLVLGNWMLDPQTRYQKITEKSLEEPKATIQAIIKWIKLYYVGGMLESALAPNFAKCGGSGKARPTRKIQEVLVELIVYGYKTYYLDDPYGVSTIEEARIKTIKEHWDPKIPRSEEFDYDTFYRYGAMHFPDAYANKVRRRNRKNAARESKLNRGRSSDLANGPGTAFQIDWTQLDVYLVASFNRMLYIGRPYLYLVVDCSSKLIVGILITIANPSLRTFCHALYYAAMNKKKLASLFGLTIEEGDWLGECVCVTAIADNGEAGGKGANIIGENFKIILANVESYRGDHKGIVERMHLSMKSEMRTPLAGYGQLLDKYGKKLGIDPRKEACLTLEELFKIGILSAIRINNQMMEKHPDYSDLVSNLVDKTPNAIWKWAEQYGHGVQRRYDEKELWLNFFNKRKPVTPSQYGFRILKHDFIPVAEEDCKLLENLINQPNGAGKQIVSYDPASFKNKYWIYNDRLIPLRKLSEDEQEFSNIWEMIALNGYYNSRGDALAQAKDAAKIEMSQGFDTLTQQAKEKQDTNKRVTTENSDLARSIEKEIENLFHQKSSPFLDASDKTPADEKVDQALVEELTSPFEAQFTQYKARS
jgi:hypothetical protein